MKRITVILLTAVYLLSAIGVSTSSFYCCGVLKSTSLSIGEVHDTDTKAPGAKDNCCKNTKKTFKVKDNHFAASSLWTSPKFFPAFIATPLLCTLNRAPVVTVHTAFNSHAPPFGQHTPIYTLNCTYRI